jgi:hypothetical protein
MRKPLSLLLFALISLGMSLPLYAGQLTMSNEFVVKGAYVSHYVDGVIQENDQWGNIFGSRGSYEVQDGVSVSWGLEAYDKTWGYTDESEDSELAWKNIYATWQTGNLVLDAGYIDKMLAGGLARTDKSGGIGVEYQLSKQDVITSFLVLTSENDADGYIDDDYVSGEAVMNTEPSALSDDGDEQDAYRLAIAYSHTFGAAPGPSAGPPSGPPSAGPSVGVVYSSMINQAFGTQNHMIGLTGGTSILDTIILADVSTFWGDAAMGPPGMETASDVTGLAANIRLQKRFTDKLAATLGFYFVLGDEDGDADTYIADVEGKGESKMLLAGLGPMERNDRTMLLIGGPAGEINNMSEQGSYAMTLSGDYQISPKATLSAGVAYAIPQVEIESGFGVVNYDSITELNTGFAYKINESVTFGLGACWVNVDGYTAMGDSAYEEDQWAAASSLTFAF